MKYAYREGYSLNGLDPDDLGRVLEGIALSNGGLITTQAVKETARDKKHILHRHVFDKAVSEAAEAYYESRARYITRSIYLIVPERPEMQPPMAINILGSPSEDDLGNRVLDRGYRMLDEVVADPGMRKEMLRRVWETILRMKRLYQHLSEFSEIWDAVERVEKDKAPAKKVAGKRK